MRVKHVLWRVKNGWIRTPDDSPYIRSQEAENIMVFKNLRQFCDYFDREQKRRIQLAVMPEQKKKASA